MIKVSIQNRPRVDIEIHRITPVPISTPPIQTIALNPYPDYTGHVSVVPADTEQVLRTADTLLRSDIRIAPIPSNYGRIEYDGSSLRIV